jgi:dihydrodipicolinate synthase/N-acetylneuraminate lyase
VSGLANAVPEVVVALYGAIQRAEGDAARLAASRLRELCQHMMAVEFPLSVAAAMEARGRPVGSPKTLLSLATRARYEWLVADLRTLYRAWELP